jgi:hypothetical protein
MDLICITIIICGEGGAAFEGRYNQMGRTDLWFLAQLLARSPCGRDIYLTSLHEDLPMASLQEGMGRSGPLAR